MKKTIITGLALAASLSACSHPSKAAEHHSAAYLKYERVLDKGSDYAPINEDDAATLAYRYCGKDQLDVVSNLLDDAPGVANPTEFGAQLGSVLYGYCPKEVPIVQSALSQYGG